MILKALETSTDRRLLPVESARSRADASRAHDAQEQLDEVPIEIS